MCLHAWLSIFRSSINLFLFSIDESRLDLADLVSGSLLVRQPSCLPTFAATMVWMNSHPLVVSVSLVSSYTSLVYFGSSGLFSDPGNRSLNHFIEGHTGYPYPRSTSRFPYPGHFGSSHRSVMANHLSGRNKSRTAVRTRGERSRVACSDIKTSDKMASRNGMYSRFSSDVQSLISVMILLQSGFGFCDPRIQCVGLLFIGHHVPISI